MEQQTDNSLYSGLTAGGIGGVIITLAIIIYKILQGRKLLSKCCGAELNISKEESSRQMQSPPPQIIQIVSPTPASTPVLGPKSVHNEIPKLEV